MFCNGGDRVEGGHTPEHDLCLKLGVNPVYGLGDKIQSSSWLLKPDYIYESVYKEDETIRK